VRFSWSEIVLSRSPQKSTRRVAGPLNYPGPLAFANAYICSQAQQAREVELLSRVSELQDSLAKSTETVTSLEAALRARQSMSETAQTAPLAPLAAEQTPVALPARRGEVAELRRQLALLADARRHDQRMLIDAEERAQALASEAAVWAPNVLRLPVRPRTDPPCAQAHGRLLQELKALQAQHSTALELLGERNERVDELEQDLADARTIYRSQILMLCPQMA